MGYFNIKNNYIFRTDEKFKTIIDRFEKSLKPEELITIHLVTNGKHHKKYKKLVKIQYNHLKDEFRRLPKEKFFEKWVNINYEGKDAINKSWEIIYDYFHIRKNGFISDIRDFSKKLSEDYEGTSYVFPQGSVIVLNVLKYPSNILLKITGKYSIEKSFQVNLKNIKRITGTLKYLKIYYSSDILFLGDEVKIINNN